MKKLSFLALAISLTAFSSCDLGSSSNCTSQYVGVAATAVTGPTTAAVNESVNFQVTFKVANDCGAFQLFHNELGEPNEVNVTVNAKYDGCSCGTTEKTLTEAYAFKAIQPGTYVLHFNTGATTATIDKTIVVN